MSHCGATVPACPNRCECGLEVKAELEAELALLDAQDHGQGIVPELAQSPADRASEAPRRIRGRILSLSFTRGNR